MLCINPFSFLLFTEQTLTIISPSSVLSKRFFATHDLIINNVNYLKKHIFLNKFYNTENHKTPNNHLAQFNLDFFFLEKELYNYFSKNTYPVFQPKSGKDRERMKGK